MIRTAYRVRAWFRALFARDLTEREMRGEMALHL